MTGGAQLSEVRPRSGRRTDIQGLRMLAVVGVVVSHFWSWPVGGFVGVDVFFVISGFLITDLLLREHERSGRISFVDFYRRRVKRLMPAALLVLMATTVGSALLLPQPRAQGAAVDAGFAALFSVNWRLAAVGTDYFEAGRAPSPVQHYWSLSVEEQFYIVWPLVLAIVLWAAAARRRKAMLLLAAAVVTAASFAWALHETSAAPTLAYFSTLSRAWELGVGVLVAVAARMTRRRLPRAIAPWVGLIGSVGILASFLVVLPAPGFPAPSALLPVLSTAAVIVAGLGADAQYDRINVLLTNRPAQLLGEVSYSLYLWHFPIAVLGAAVLPPDSLLRSVGGVLLSVALAWLSFRFVEDPARRTSWRPGVRRWRVRRLALVTVVAAAVVALTATATVHLVRPTQAVAAEEAGAPGCVGADSLLNECGPEDLSGVLAPGVDAFEDDAGSMYRCWRPEGGEAVPCTVGDPDADTRVALVGDSHAAMLLTALEPAAEERGWALDTFLGYGCQWRDGDPTSDCEAPRREMMDQLESGAYDIIITSGARWAATDEGAADGYAAAWQRAADRGARVVVVGDAPEVSAEALACVQRIGMDPRRPPCVTSHEDAFAQVDPMPAAARKADAAFVDMTDLYCTPGGCPAVIGGVVVYRDTVGHVTATYMETVAPELVERIAAAAR
ncbi:acyltransferase family protein [Agrococcus sp. KRD186]|jgi:peptidoglycan/LPS O-acetylase OafA/YrhL|uniref:acyltransferase family protein n=1 Tax=Agrococcus sp. KRD186 TaxID=2729730 RepID=UPI0019CFD986|nr:acyltransferase family protein [Agrococcus sp. KRD186]